MNRGKTVAVIVTAAVLVICGAVIAVHKNPKSTYVSHAQPIQLSAPPPPIAVFFGDSYFNGANGITPGNTMAGLAGNSLGYLTFIKGHGGTGFVGADKAAPHTPNYQVQIAQGALADVDERYVKLVVIEGGLNDLDQQIGQVGSAATTILAAAHRTFPKAKVVLVGPVAPSGTASAADMEVIHQLQLAAFAQQVPFIDTTTWVTPANAGQIIGPDRTHPTAAGHRSLAGKLTAALQAS